MKVHEPEGLLVIVTEGFFLLAFWKIDIGDFIAVASESIYKSNAFFFVSYTYVIKASEDTRDQTHQEV